MALGTSTLTDLKSPEDTSVHQGMLTVMPWRPGEGQTVCTPWGEAYCCQKLMRGLAKEAVGVGWGSALRLQLTAVRPWVSSVKWEQGYSFLRASF